MEKKNTMLLTVIAVATLLVAVVGATFAYFSITASGNSTTVVNTQTQKLPTITMTEGKSTFGISVTASDMAMNNVGPRWAMNTGDESASQSNDSNGKNDGDGKLYYWSQNEIKHNLFNIKADTPTSSENDALDYECPVTITLTAGEKVPELTQGDLILYLYSKGGDVLVSDPSDDGRDKTDDLINDWKGNTNSYLMEKTTEEQDHANENNCSAESKKGCYDVSDLFEEPNETKTLYTVVIVNADNSSNEGTSVEASMKLVNKNSNQSSLAGQSIQITLTSKLAQEGCKVITKEAE